MLSSLPSQASLAHHPRRLIGATVVLVLGLLVTLAVRILVDDGAGTRSPGAVAAQAGAQAATAGCADVLFVGVDGGAETPPAGRTFGRTVGLVHDGYLRRMAGTGWTVGSTRVPYTTPPIERIKRSPTATGAANRVVTTTSANAWRTGNDMATWAVQSRLDAVARICPHQQLVLVGYSQGAMAVHRALNRMDATTRSRVTGVGLVGDPTRTGGTRAFLYGDPVAARTGSGVINRLFRVGTDVPAAGWTQPVWTLCNRGDVACDFSATRIAPAIAAHKAYAATTAGRARLDGVSSALWGRTIQHPKPGVDPFNVTGEVWRPVSAQLPVVVWSGSRSNMRWSARGAMPPGLVLTSTGQVRGTPTLAGTWTVPYSVYDGIRPEFARRVPGTLVIVVRASAAGAITVGGGQACTLQVDRSIRCWGRNNWGQLGDGTTTNRPLAQQVGVAKDWASVTTSGSTTCATKVSGALYCWGLNYRGQVGDGTYTTRLAPVAVAAGTTWGSVSNSFFHTCGVRKDTTLWCWGANHEGQIGDGTRTHRPRPVRIGTATGWATVQAGGWHVCATKTDGSLWCWGLNTFGQLGDGTTTSRSTPVRVGTGNDWTAVSADWSHTCGIRASGEARCWGRNTRGQLGDATGTSRANPTPVVGGFAWTSINAGDSHTCGTTSDGVLRCWGGSPLGALGTGTTTVRVTPYPVAMPGPWRQADAGWVNGCGLKATGTAYCWGSNEYGQLGDGGYTDALSPVEVK